MTTLTRRTVLAASVALCAVPVARARPHFTREEILRHVDAGRLFTCYLNGVEIDRVLDADPDAGWVEVGLRHPRHGGYYLVDANGKESRYGVDVARGKRFGRVDVEPIGWSA